MECLCESTTKINQIIIAQSVISPETQVTCSNSGRFKCSVSLRYTVTPQPKG